MARYRALKTIQLNDGPGRSRLVSAGEEFDAREGLTGKSIVCLDAPAKQVKVPKAAPKQPQEPPATDSGTDSLA